MHSVWMNHGKFPSVVLVSHVKSLFTMRNCFLRVPFCSESTLLNLMNPLRHPWPEQPGLDTMSTRLSCTYQPQPDSMVPPKLVQPGDVQQFSRHAVRLRAIEREVGAGIDDIAERLGELQDRQIFTGPDVDMRGGVIVLHQKHTRVRQVVHMEKLAARGAAAPDGHLTVTAFAGFVEFADQRRQDVRAAQIEVVVDPIEVRRHSRDERTAVLGSIGLAELNA